MTLSCGSGSP
ncbi:hypothetical protein YPPY102_1543, partial [Yersinia pestis PY-102]